MRHVRRQLSQALDDGTIGVTPKKSMTDFSRCVRACVCERARAPMALPHRTLPHSLSLYAALLTFIPLSAGWPAGWIAACSIAIFFAFSTIHSSQSSILWYVEMEWQRKRYREREVCQNGSYFLNRELAWFKRNIALCKWRLRYIFQSISSRADIYLRHGKNLQSISPIPNRWIKFNSFLCVSVFLHAANARERPITVRTMAMKKWVFHLFHFLRVDFSTAVQVHTRITSCGCCFFLLLSFA